MASILVLDYGPDNRELIRCLLLYRGHQGDPVSSAEEALARIPLHRPDGITINPMLPGLNGFDLCEHLKSRRDTCMIPIVFATGLSGEYLDLGFRSGSNAYVTLPFTCDEFFKVIEEALRWPVDHAAGRGAGEIVFDTRHEERRLRQTNDLNVDVLSLTSLSEHDARVLKQIVLEMGDGLKDWGGQGRCERVASLRWKVEADRIDLAFCQDGLPTASPEDPLRGSLDVLLKTCGFVEASGGRAEGSIALTKVIRA